MERGEIAIIVVSFVRIVVDAGLLPHIIPSTSGDAVSLGILKVEGDLDMPPSVDERLETGEMAMFGISFGSMVEILSMDLISCTSGDSVHLGILIVECGLITHLSADEKLEEIVIFVISFVASRSDVGLSVYLVPFRSGDTLSLGKGADGLDMPPCTDERL